jgi:hypothetical protein
LDFADLSLDFFLAARVRSAMQDRFLAIGELDGRLIVAACFARWEAKRSR